MVDDEDFEFLNQWKWYCHPIKSKYSEEPIFYARRSYTENNIKKSVYMHRFILKLRDKNTSVDHIDHNGLNNQKLNLRTADKRQNAVNQRPMRGTSKYLGVSYRYWKNRQGDIKERWVIQIQIEKSKRKNLGVFPYTPEGEIEAAKKYDLMAKNIYGEFANLNFKND